MPTYIINNHGVPQAIDAIAYRDLLMEPSTGKPLLNEEALAHSPHKEKVQALIAEFVPIDIQKLIKDSAESLETLDKKSPEFLAARSEVNKSFGSLARLLNNPTITPLLIKAPKADALLAYKISNHTYGFTPEEVAILCENKNIDLLINNRFHALVPALIETMSPARQKTFFRKEMMETFLEHGFDAIASTIYEQHKSTLTTADKEKLMHAATQGQCPHSAKIIFDEIYPTGRAGKASMAKKFNRAKEKLLSIKGPSPSDVITSAKDPNISMADFAEKWEQMDLGTRAKKFCDFWNEQTFATNNNESNLSKFIAKRIAWKGLNESRQPIHDALLNAVLPYEEEWNKPVWLSLLNKQMETPFDETNNPDLLPVLRKAQKIEEALSEKGISLEKATPDLLCRIAHEIKYTRGGDEDLAELCKLHHISERGFQRGVEARQNMAEEDHIPDIGCIEGEDIGHPGYYMLKLTKDDPRILLVGEYAHCCNKLDGHTERMALAHVTSPDGGCYAIFHKSDIPERDEIVAKTSVFLGKEDEKTEKYDVCFNSWERRPAKEGMKPELIGEAFLKEAARRCLAQDPHIERVTLGKNRDGYGFMKVDHTVKPRDPNTASSDSSTQHLITSRKIEKELSASPERLRA